MPELRGWCTRLVDVVVVGAVAVVVVGSTDTGGRTTVARLLRDAGHAVIEAADGEEVRAAIDQHGAQVVLLDDSMSALAQLQAHDDTRRLVPDYTRIVVSGSFSADHNTGMPGEALWRMEGLRPELLLECIVGLSPDARRSGDTHQAQAELAAIVWSSHDAIMGKTLDGRITSWNPGAERLYGYTAAEITGQPARILFPADQQTDEAGILQRISAGERVEQYQTQRVRKDGSRITVSLTVSPIVDKRGRIVGAASVSRDMDPRQQAEARFRGLLDAAPDSIICVDASGAIVLVNAHAERLLGYSRNELLGQPVELIIPEGVPQDQAEHLVKAAGQLAAVCLYPSILRKDGSPFPADISLSAFETSGGVVLSVAIRDATERLQAQAERERLTAQAERERLERQLQQAQRLESLGQLAGGVAHDFNNMLGIILNYAAFIQEEVTAAAHGAHQRDWAPVCADTQQVTRAAERAAALTHQLLAFARREVVRPQVLNLNTIVAEIEQMLRRTLGEHIQLITDQDDDLCPILVDPSQIEQVLVNLAVNARDAMPSGGTLTITTRNHTGDDLARYDPPVPPGRYACLQVTDTGTGIPKNVLERVFEPFFTTKPSGQGTGLGLATAYGAITQADGHLRINSEVNVGTTIIALLPVTEQNAHTPQTGLSAPAHQRIGRGGTILVVEDEDGIREVTRRLLTRNGYRVITAANGPDAIEAARWHDGPIDLLLTDVVMPHMLGKEVAEKVQSLYPDIHVLYMSGYAQSVLSTHGTLNPGIRLIEKPFTEPDLIDPIRELLDTDAPGNG
jgi:PAS domain S-box-containing protein